MSDSRDVAQRGEPTGYLLVVYILFLAAFVNGITWIVAGVMAYVGKGEAPAWQQSHYQFQIRTFWIGILFSAISVVTTFIFIGFVLGALTAIWAIVRCIKGISWLQKGEPVPHPESWMFGDLKT